MPALEEILGYCRNSKLVIRALWFVIALGVVPTVIAQTVVPLDIFSLQFGVDSTNITSPPWVLNLTAYLKRSLIRRNQRPHLPFV